MAHEKAFAFTPVDQQVFGQKHCHHHAQSVVHPAGFQQLAHGGVNNRQTGTCFLPGGEVIGGVAPRQGFGFGAKRPVPGNPWITHQNVFIELAPQQFIDPGHGTGTSALKLTPIALQCRMQALAGRNHSGGEVGRELAGAGFRREVPFAFVVIDLRIGKTVEATTGFGLSRGPQVAQAGVGRGESCDRRGDSVAGDVQRRLYIGRVHETGQRMMQPFITDFAELAEDLKVAAGFGQHAAGLKQQLIEVAVYFDAFGFQGAGDRGIPPGFMDAVFVVEVQCVDLQLPAQVEQYRWRLIPARGRADQQGNIQLTQFMAQLRQIAQPEIHFAGGVVMLQPLLRTQQIHRHTRSASGGGREGGVVM
ncbi:hypothetical protein D3C84_668470 [compost metagenome]